MPVQQDLNGPGTSGAACFSLSARLISVNTNPSRSTVAPVGVIMIGTREIDVRAVRTRSERLKDAVDRAHLQKYDSPGSVKHARDLGREKSRAATIELVPFTPE